MKLSKKYQSEFTLVGSWLRIVLMAILAAGCIRPQTHDQNSAVVDHVEDDPTSTFFIESLSGRSEVPENLPGYSIPVKRTFHFEACIKDRRTLEAVSGHRFLIRGGEADQSSRTDASGCLSWSESMAFNFLADETYVSIRRNLTADGIHAGARLLTVAINPWNLGGRSKDVVDLSREALPMSILARESETSARLSGHKDGIGDGGPMARNLWVKSLALKNKPGEITTEGIGRHLTLEFTPALPLTDVQKQKHVFVLTEAQLRAEVTLIQSASSGEKSQDRVLWQTQAPVDVKLEDQVFRFHVEPFFYQGDFSDRLKLVLRVEPRDGPPGLGGFHGLYEIGTLEEFTKGKSVPELRISNSDSDFTAETYLQGVLPLTKGAPVSAPSSDERPSNSISIGNFKGLRVAESSGADKVCTFSVEESNKLKPFQISMVEVKWGREEPESTLTNRVASYILMVCLKDNTRGGVPASGMKFDFVNPDGDVEPVTTGKESSPGNPAGCFTWKGRLSHQFYASEQFYLLPFSVRHESGFEEKRVASIYPWNLFYLTRWDAQREADCDFVRETNSRKPIPSRLVIHGVSFQTIENPRYEVDRFLALRPIKRVQIRAHLSASRHSSLVGGRSANAEILRDGIVAVRAAIYASGTDASGKKYEIVSPILGGARLAPVVGGAIHMGVEFPIHDVRLSKVRSYLVMEVLPVDERRLTEKERENPQSYKGSVEAISYKNPSVTGLVTPTYAGPIVLHAKDGSLDLRPTENIEIEYREKSLQSADPNEMLKALSGKTMDQILRRAEELSKAYVAEMTERARLSKILQSGNLEYMSLFNEEKILGRDSSLGANNKGLPKKKIADYAITVLNRPLNVALQGKDADEARLPSPITPKGLAQIVEGKKRFDRALAMRFCALLFKEVISKVSPGQKFVMHRRGSGAVVSTDYFSNVCVRDLLDRPIQDVITFERKYRVFESGQAKFLRAPTMDFTIGAETRFSTAMDMSYGAELGGGADVVRLIGMVTSLVPGLNILSAAAMIGGGLKIGASGSISKGTSTGEGSGVSTRIPLSMERIDMEIPLVQYEACSVVRVSPRFWERRMSFQKYMNPVFKTEDIAAMTTRGIMMCTGYQSSERLNVQERYYTFTQGRFEETFTSQEDMRTNLWLLTLRGVRDFSAFRAQLLAKPEHPVDVPGAIDITEYPLEHLENAYLGRLPTMPGIYSVDSFHLPPPQKKRGLFEFWN